MGGTPLAGRHAVVTGGGSGIGRAVALSLARLGAAVTVMGRRRERLDGTVAALGAGHGAQACDVTDQDSVARAFAQAAEALGPVAILVNNAGIAQSAPFGRTDRAMLDGIMATNLTGPWLCTQAVLPGMLAAGWGRVVSVASTAGLIGYAYVSAYCASKHAVIGLTRSLALETARSGVTVNAVCPGYVETEIVQEAIANIVAKTGRSVDEARASLTERNPQKRLIQPEEVGEAVAWLCLPASASITGQAIPVAGGEVM